MRERTAGDFDYERGGHSYPKHRRADPRIAGLINAALGDARTVVNVGAGTGSYEPTDRLVLAVEPSRRMRVGRPAHLAPAIDAVAEALPFDAATFDAAMALVTVHQWSDPVKGLAELRRVSRGAVVILTFDGEALDRYWLAEYVPELIAAERRRYPPLDWIAETLGGTVTVDPVPVPIDCVDGFAEAFYARPEQLLVEDVRRSQSAWAFVGADIESRFVEQLSSDVVGGAWDRRHGHLRGEPSFEGSLRLIVAR